MWHYESPTPLPAYLTREIARLRIPDTPLVAVETKWNNGSWMKGWLLFTDRRIFLFRTSIGFKGMEEFSYWDDLAVSDRSLSRKKWFTLGGVSFMMSEADTTYLYSFVDQYQQQQAQMRAAQQAPAAVPQQLSKADELAKLAQLRDSGVLTSEEFACEKAALLGSSAATSAPAAWYPDPRSRHEMRYWDGQTWTSHVSDSGVVGSDPV